MNFLKIIFNFFKKALIFLLAFLLFDIVFFTFIPSDIKSKLYNNRAHRIKSFYYHHDLRPMASFYDHWGYEKYQIFTNNLGFKDKNNRKINFKDIIIDEKVSKVSIVGVGMITTPGVTFRMFNALAKKKINILVISTSEIKISVLVNKKNLKKAVDVLHKEFKLDY